MQGLPCMNRAGSLLNCGPHWAVQNGEGNTPTCMDLAVMVCALCMDCVVGFVVCMFVGQACFKAPIPTIHPSHDFFWYVMLLDCPFFSSFFGRCSFSPFLMFFLLICQNQWCLTSYNYPSILIAVREFGGNHWLICFLFSFFYFSCVCVVSSDQWCNHNLRYLSVNSLEGFEDDAYVLRSGKIACSVLHGIYFKHFGDIYR